MNTTTLRDAIKTTLYDLTVSSFGSAVPSILRFYESNETSACELTSAVVAQRL